METQGLSEKHLEVINELKKEHLTSFEILNRVHSISFILVVYDILDELHNMGILKSYVKKEMKYHYIRTK